jgi:hypothetical protein
VSTLNPGGYRGPRYYSGQHDNRLFTFASIHRAIQRHKPDHSKGAETSIARGNRNGIKVLGDAVTPHEHRREIARRQRQEHIADLRKAAKLG